MKVLAGLAVAFLLGGCGSMFNLTLSCKPQPYGGVLLDTCFVGGTSFVDASIVTAPIAIADMPLSFALDTVTLPIAFARQAQERD
jgi:uncharacterized protein YceK